MNVKSHMGEPEGGVTISSDGWLSLPSKLALIVLILPICYSVLSGIDVGSFTSEVDCEDPVPEALRRLVTIPGRTATGNSAV